MNTSYEEYVPLTKESAAEYVISHNLMNRDPNLTCDEIGDGNLNYVFRIRNLVSGQSKIVKQALPYAKVVGESWPLTLNRAKIESDYLIQASQFVPQLVPKVYISDNNMAVTVMEDLSHLMILRRGLTDGNIYPKLAEHMGQYMAHTLFYTSDFGMNQQEKKKLAAQYNNPELCKITEDLVFTDPFFNHDTNDYSESLQPEVDRIWQDDPLKLEVASLKLKFLTHAESLLHGDLHTGSIFVDQEETKVIDPEFAFFGPMGFDIGAFIANLFLNALAQEAHIEDLEQRKAYQSYLLEIVEKTWDTFQHTFTELWNHHNVEPFANNPSLLDRVMEQIRKDTVGFAGCKIIRRTIGLAHVADIKSIKNESKRLQVEASALRLGRAFVLHHQQNKHISELSTILKEELLNG